MKIRFNKIPKIGYLLALLVILSGAFVFILLRPTANPAKPVSADELQYFALTDRIVALETKLPAEGVVSGRLRTSLEELKNELGVNKAVLEDPRTTVATAEKTRARNKEIAQTIDQIEKDLSTGFDAFEAAGTEQLVIDSIFYSPPSSTETTNGL